MKKRISFKLNNKGSGIVTVLIAVVLLTLMGSLLLMLAFTGFEMKASDREGKQNTYDASTAMDEIKVGLQSAVSKAIENSYSEALKRYSQKGEQVQTQFAKNYISAFKDSQINGRRLIIKTGDSEHYDVEAIKSLVVNCRDGEANVTTIRDEAKVITSENQSKLTFKNVSVSYTNKGRTTSITTDIVITVPDISYSLSQFSVSGVPSFSAIVGGTLKQTGVGAGETSITGGAYMDNLVLESNSQIKLKDGIFVCKNNADIKGTYTGGTDERIIVDTEATFWANNIVVRGNTNASFLGNTYVANDLNFAGANSNVTLSGTYTGFGAGGENGRTPEKASSIVVNGKKNKLNIEGLSNLILAGFSFVGESSIGNSGDQYASSILMPSNSTKIKMGESFSVKENQKIYLIPDEHLSYTMIGSATGSGDTRPKTNPDIFPSSYSLINEGGKYYIINTKTEGEEEKIITKHEIKLETDKLLWSVGNKKEDERFYSSYNAKLQPVCVIANNQLIVYYFLSFSDTVENDEIKINANEHANQFFRDYVKANPVAVNNYVDKYIRVSKSKVASQTMGNFFVGGDEKLTFRDFLSNSQSLGIISNSKNYEGYYSNICQTLSYTEKSEGDNPFTYYIDIAKIKSEINDDEEFVDENGNVCALVVDGEYNYNDASPNSIHLIVATGDVKVTKTFNGLIFCGGELTLDTDTSIIANSKEVEKAYACTAEVGGKDRVVGDYFKVPIGQTSKNENSATSIYSRNISSLVTYSNWKKN